MTERNNAHATRTQSRVGRKSITKVSGLITKPAVKVPSDVTVDNGRADNGSRVEIDSQPRKLVQPPLVAAWLPTTRSNNPTTARLDIHPQATLANSTLGKTSGTSVRALRSERQPYGEALPSKRRSRGKGSRGEGSRGEPQNPSATLVDAAASLCRAVKADGATRGVDTAAALSADRFYKYPGLNSCGADTVRICFKADQFRVADANKFTLWTASTLTQRRATHHATSESTGRRYQRPLSDISLFKNEASHPVRGVCAVYNVGALKVQIKRPSRTDPRCPVHCMVTFSVAGYGRADNYQPCPGLGLAKVIARLQQDLTAIGLIVDVKAGIVSRLDLFWNIPLNYAVSDYLEMLAQMCVSRMDARLPGGRHLYRGVSFQPSARFV